MAEALKTEAVIFVMASGSDHSFCLFGNGRSDDDKGDIGVSVIGMRSYAVQSLFPGQRIKPLEVFFIQSISQGKKYLLIGFRFADGCRFCKKIGAAV